MNREIKFRAWNNVKKEWLLGYEYKSLGGFSICGEMMMMGEWSNILHQMLNGYFGERGEELKVMQYTGLKDKNGVEIYEGDIFCDDTEGLDYDFVEWDEMQNGWTTHTWYGTDEFRNLEDMEIEGNIYQNPEILK